MNYYLGANGTSYECDCQKYYQCANNGLWLMCCPPNLHFNETLQQCQNPSDSSCIENPICFSSTTTSISTTTTPSTSPTTSELEPKCNPGGIPANCSLGPPPENAEYANCR